MNKRPFGVAIISIFLILNGLLLIGSITLFNPTIEEAVNILLGISTDYAQTSIVILSVLTLIAGLSLWFEQKWGWWLAVIYLCFGVFRQVDALRLLLMGDFQNLVTDAKNLGGYYLRYTLRVILDFLVLAYLFKSSILGYFQVAKNENNKKFLAILVAGACLFLIFAVPTYMRESKEFNQVMDVYETGDLNKALDEINSYLTDFPESDEGWTLKGNILMDKGELEQARDAYSKTLILNPDHPKALIGLGSVYKNQKLYDQAYDAYWKALKLQPRDKDIFSNLILIELKRDHDQKALEFAEQVYEFHSKDPNVAANLAIAYHYNKMFDERDQMTERAKKLGYEDADILYKLYRGWFSIKD